MCQMLISIARVIRLAIWQRLLAASLSDSALERDNLAMILVATAAASIAADIKTRNVNMFI